MEYKEIELLYQCLTNLDFSIEKNNLVNRLEELDDLDDILPIDQDIDDCLWHIVPQLVFWLSDTENRLSQFKSYKTIYTVNKTFIFINPIYICILEKLKIELKSLNFELEEVKDILFTERLSYILYGGYPWHSAYLSANRYLNLINHTAKILIISNATAKNIKDLIHYKNQNRSLLAEPIRINKELIKQPMDGLIQAFHCPDIIENTRQLLALGLIQRNEVIYDDKNYWRS
ncbi:hypothetical protein A9Z61_11265 [Moraxella osloensis]|jgi:hypothetical protein|uniref:Uncharacterized protein n=1 Tax=Moraxella tetraodonis TaxID=2767221 RepID=A0A9X2A535_9GAMM|nr:MULTISPECIES: hypothetical protein [Moraxella]MCG8148607.1 hypothetical protein [Moraxella tetraodonis]OBX56725.1 hypothetical protein A9Z61_11265 [Moraxella osloensis]